MPAVSRTELVTSEMVPLPIRIRCQARTHPWTQNDPIGCTFRRQDLCPEEDTDNENVIVLPNDLFISLIDESLQQRITNSTDLDGSAAEALKLLLGTGSSAMTTGLEDWTIDQSNDRNTLFYKGKNYIPRNMELRRDIVHSFHDHPTAGHPGEIGTYNAV